MQSAWTRVALVALLAIPTAGAALGQVVASNKVIGQTRLDPAQVAPYEVTRLALLDLRSLDAPEPADYAIASQILSIAQELAPTEADIVRRRAEAAFSAGETDVVDACTKRLVELDPADTVAQLRYITSRIDQYQTAEQRLAAFDSLLGPKGDSIDPSVRSRLALDAALLARERGDASGFVERLKQAIGLDATNKDAALLAYTYFAERVDDSQGRLELLTNLLYADPLDRKTLRLMRDEFAQAGAFAASLRFHRMIDAIQIASSIPASESFQLEGYLLDWLNRGPEVVVTELSTKVAAERHRVEATNSNDPASQDSLGTVRPEDIRLSLGFEALRVVACKAQGEKGNPTLVAAMKDLWTTTQNQSQAVLDRTRRPAGMSDQSAFEVAIGIVVETKLLRLLVNIGEDAGSGALDEAVAALAASDLRRVAIESWTLLRAGKDDEAIARVQGKEEDSSWTGALVGEALLAKGDVGGAASAFAKTAERFPLSSIGAYCAQRTIELKPDMPRFQEARRLEHYNSQLPRWLDELGAQPRRTQLLAAEFPNWSASALQRVPVRVRLKNLLPIPAGFGSGRTISTRLFFAPSLEVGVRTRNDSAAGEVIELDRRLRLNPGEELSVLVNPDAGLIGYLAEVAAADPSRLRWRVLQGFELRGDGSRHSGPGSVEASTGTLNREALPEARETLPKLAELLVKAKEHELVPLIYAIRAKLMGGRPDGTPDPDSPGVLKFLVQLYPTWPAPVRMVAITIMPPASILPGMAPFDEVLKVDPDPTVLALALLTRATLATDPALIEAGKSADLRLARVASLHAARLEANKQTYSKRGANVLAAPPTPLGLPK